MVAQTGPDWAILSCKSIGMNMSGWAYCSPECNQSPKEEDEKGYRLGIKACHSSCLPLGADLGFQY